MEIEPHDWARVAFVNVILIKTSFRSSAVVTVCLIDISLFGADIESRGFVIREIESCDRNFASLVMTCMYKFQCFLNYMSVFTSPSKKQIYTLVAEQACLLASCTPYRPYCW